MAHAQVILKEIILIMAEKIINSYLKICGLVIHISLGKKH